MCVLFVATVPVSGDHNPASPDTGPAGRSSGTSAHFHGSGGVFPLCAGGPGFDLWSCYMKGVIKIGPNSFLLCALLIRMCLVAFLLNLIKKWNGFPWNEQSS